MEDATATWLEKRMLLPIMAHNGVRQIGSVGKFADTESAD